MQADDQNRPMSETGQPGLMAYTSWYGAIYKLD